MLRRWVLPFVVYALYRAWTATWRISIVESETVKSLKAAKGSWVCAIWHGDELAIVPFCRFYKVATMTSTSKDGELMDRVLKMLGMATSRGSSTRGAVSALKGLVRLTREGWSPVVTVDGPKGPYHKVKPGVFEIAKLTGLKIVPVGVYSSNSYVFKKSWNKAHFPLPFSKVCLVWGEAFDWNPESDPRNPEIADKLGSSIDAMGRTAVNLFAKT